MRILRWSLVLAAALLLARPDIVGQAMAAQQAIANKSQCAHVGGQVKPNPWSTGEYPFLCIYPDKYDRQCQSKLDETAYYDVAKRKCVSELLCDLEGIC